MADIVATPHGTITELEADSPAGEEFLSEFDFEDWQVWGNAWVVDHRPALEILRTAAALGLKIEVRE